MAVKRKPRWNFHLESTPGVATRYLHQAICYWIAPLTCTYVGLN